MQKIHIGAEEQGCRADRVVRKRLPLMPLSAIYMLFRKGKVLAGDRKIRQDYRLCFGEILQIDVSEAEVAIPEAPEASLRQLAGTSFYRKNFSIIYEDDNLLACNKPPGLVVHPGSGHTSHDSLIELAIAYLLTKDGIPEGEEPALVHRLDRDTSGVILISKNKRTVRLLHEAFRSRKIVKEYRAICHHRPPEYEGTVTVTLSRTHERDRGMKMRVAGEGEGEVARSSYRITEYHKGLSNVTVFLETGKTHQIRVQMAHLGSPIVGDVRYGDSALDSKLFGGVRPRLYLHAYCLTLHHPVTGKKVSIKAPVPHEFSELMNRPSSTS